MSNDKTLVDECDCPNGRAEHMPTCASLRATLATAKHGGRVQLPSTAAHVLVNAEHLERVLVCAEGNHFDDCMADKNTTMTQAIEQMRGALSAQPSPGGQGDALADEIDLVRAVLDGYPDSMARSDALRAMRVIRAALAARQPVCATVKGVDHGGE